MLWKRILKEKFGDAVLGNGMKLRKLIRIRTGVFGRTDVEHDEDSLKVLCVASLSYTDVQK